MTDQSSPEKQGRGGKREGAGRRTGTKNKTTIEREFRAAAGLSAALKGILPLDVMLCRMRGEPGPSGKMFTDDQFSAALAAAPYIHPRLSSVAIDATVRRSADDYSDAELAAIAGSAGGEENVGDPPSRPH